MHWLEPESNGHHRTVRRTGAEVAALPSSRYQLQVNLELVRFRPWIHIPSLWPSVVTPAVARARVERASPNCFKDRCRSGSLAIEPVPALNEPRARAVPSVDSYFKPLAREIILSCLGELPQQLTK
ncbi:hypothetical protein GGX14DRAFT_401069 [Mycena pura]|uniref:Uncharacterized protein n=1 Tax=Mycena pura TaxID=153505 RepID=A0AAD6Y6V0_9AGAR|nr:hypothetical protein GGX14DRAFT_401069 [Mycena pura]